MRLWAKKAKYGTHVGRADRAQYYQSLAKNSALVEGVQEEFVEFMSVVMQGLGDKCFDIKHSVDSSEFRQSVPRFLYEHQLNSDFLILCWIRDLERYGHFASVFYGRQPVKYMKTRISMDYQVKITTSFVK